MEHTYLNLSLQDSNNVNASDSVIVMVNPAANLAPVANAGPAITLILPASTARLDGSKSADPDGTISSYQWTKVSGPKDPVDYGSRFGHSIAERPVCRGLRLPVNRNR